jgi:hypothetical protein
MANVVIDTPFKELDRSDELRRSRRHDEAGCSTI